MYMINHFVVYMIFIFLCAFYAVIKPRIKESALYGN